MKHNELRILRYTIFLFLVLVVLAFPLAAEDLSLPRIIDKVNVLSSEEKAELEKQIISIRNKYAFDLVILTVYDMETKNIQDYADDYYDYSGYGIGPGADGALLVHDLYNREIHISGSGKGTKVFNSGRTDNTIDRMIPSLKADQYFDAYLAFLERAEYHLDTYGEGGKGYKGILYIASAALALALSLVTFFSARTKYKTIRPQNFAANYIADGSSRFSLRNDTFISTNTSRSRKSKSSGSSSAGTHKSSSGRTHSGGGRKY